MFELGIARKYLLPRRRQLSASIISLISIMVIALVVWLIAVFFSVSAGMERGWVEKLISMTAPLRVTPTEAYFSSYYYQIDEMAEASDYTTKTIGEKRLADTSDPYDPDLDAALPSHFPDPDLDADGHLRNPVVALFQAVNALPGEYEAQASDYSTSVASFRVKLIRGREPHVRQTTLSQTAYLTTFDPDNQALVGNLLEPTPEDLRNLRGMEASVGDRIVAGLNAPVDPFRQKFDSLTYSPATGYPVLVAKNMRDNGVLMGDRGYVSYVNASASGTQEQRIPLYVAGFYDPGILPVGGRFVVADAQLVDLVLAAQGTLDPALGNGVNIRLKNTEDAHTVAEQLQHALEAAGVAKYWKIEAYDQYEFTRDILQQIRSEKRLFSLIALIIIVVACSNIVSMLIILVNDKRTEIGILRSMGASSFSIAAIFGSCGLFMGMIGSLVGTGAAWFTLRHLDQLLAWLGALQGYEVFNSSMYGESLATQMSGEALLFVLIATTVMSLIAGMIPAIKACRLQPTQILRGEG